MVLQFRPEAGPPRRPVGPLGTGLPEPPAAGNRGQIEHTRNP